MRQRRHSDSQPQIEKIRCWLKETLTGVTVESSLQVRFDKDVQIIPDEILVALAAQEGLDHAALSSFLKPKLAPGGNGPRVVNVRDAMRQLFEKSAQMHEAEFENWKDLDQYRERFRDITRTYK